MILSITIQSLFVDTEKNERTPVIRKGIEWLRPRSFLEIPTDKLVAALHVFAHQHFAERSFLLPFKTACVRCSGCKFVVIRGVGIRNRHKGDSAAKGNIAGTVIV